MAHSHVWPTFGLIVCPLLLLALANANALVGLTHHDHGKQACHHKVANSQIISLPTMQGIPHFHKKRRQTKGIVHAPYHSSSEINGKRTQAGKLDFCCSQCVPNVFSLCFNQDLNEFPTCSSSSHSPYFIQHSLP